MQLIMALLAFNLFWTLGRALASFFIAAVTGLAAYSLARYWAIPTLEAWVMPQIPSFVGCAMKSVGFGDSFSVVIGALQARVTLMVIYWANKSIIG